MDGEITSIADTKHAYGFTTEDDVDVLVHFGIDTVALKGEGFTLHANVGDKVKKGDLIAEADLEIMAKHGINTVSPVLICGGADGMELNFKGGSVEKGETLIILKEIQNETVREEISVPDKKFRLNFDLLQKLGKVLMTVIAVMPAACLMISL